MLGPPKSPNLHLCLTFPNKARETLTKYIHLRILTYGKSCISSYKMWWMCCGSAEQEAMNVLAAHQWMCWQHTNECVGSTSMTLLAAHQWMYANATECTASETVCIFDMLIFIDISWAHSLNLSRSHWNPTYSLPSVRTYCTGCYPPIIND